MRLLQTWHCPTSPQIRQGPRTTDHISLSVSSNQLAWQDPSKVQACSMQSPPDHTSCWGSAWVHLVAKLALPSPTACGPARSLQTGGRTGGNRSHTVTKLPPRTWLGKGLPRSIIINWISTFLAAIVGHCPQTTQYSLRSQPTTKPYLPAGFRNKYPNKATEDNRRWEKATEMFDIVSDAVSDGKEGDCWIADWP